MYLFYCKNNQSSLWYAYAQYECRLHNWPELEAIFGRCLLQTYSVRFWQLYLRHIRLKAYLLEQQGNRIAEDGSSEEMTVDVVQQARDMVVKAFELAVNQVGMDYEALPIWNDYLAFLRSLPVQKMPLYLPLRSLGSGTLRAAATDGGHSKGLPTSRSSANGRS